MDSKAVIYARVSSVGERQDTARQVADLTAYAAAAGLAVVAVYEEKASGAKRDREVLADCLEFLKGGGADTLLVTEISRLGRSVRQVIDIVDDLTKLGINIHIQQQGCCTLRPDGTPDPMTTVMVSMFGAFAELERAAIVDRLQSGRRIAKASGKVTFGRPAGTTMTDDEILKKYPKVAKRLRNGQTVRDVAKLEGLSTKTVQKVKGAMHTTRIDLHGGQRDIIWDRMIKPKDKE